jgi:hypothetical protein
LDGDPTAFGMDSDSRAATVHLLMELKGVRVRLCEIIAIELNLTGCRRSVEFKLCSRWNFEANAS